VKSAKVPKFSCHDFNKFMRRGIMHKEIFFSKYLLVLCAVSYPGISFSVKTKYFLEKNGIGVFSNTRIQTKVAHLKKIFHCS